MRTACYYHAANHFHYARVTSAAQAALLALALVCRWDGPFAQESPPTTPGLAYSTHLGSDQSDAAATVALDAAGNVYLAGTTASTNFLGSGQPLAGSGGSNDIFVVKLAPGGKPLLWAVRFGGSDDDRVEGIALGEDGLWLVGSTASADFPWSGSATGSGGARDGFVARLSTDGSSLGLAVRLGGSGDDSVRAVAVGEPGGLWVAGWTESSDFPTERGLMAYGGGRDAFVSKLSRTDGGLLFSSFLGGAGDDEAAAVFLDGSGNLTLAGSSTSGPGGLPGATTLGPCGGSDVLLAAVAADASALRFLALIGGSGDDNAQALAPAGPGLLLAGGTSSRDFPGLVPDSAAGGEDAFVLEVATTPLGSPSGYRLGGAGSDRALAIALAADGVAWVAGRTTSPTLPTLHAFQPIPGGGGTDGFVARLQRSLTTGGEPGPSERWVANFVSFLGSSGPDAVQGMAVGSGAAVHLVGATRPGARGVYFPTTPDAAQNSPAGENDGFLTIVEEVPTIPRNDALADAPLLAAEAVTVLGSNVGATLEAGEPPHVGGASGASVWWRWRSPVAGPVVATTLGSDFDTVLAVYQGADLASLREVAANDDDPTGGNPSRVVFDAEAGASYAVAVSGKNGAQGHVTLSLSTTRPPNDDFQYRTVIPGLGQTVRGSGLGASVEEGDPALIGWANNEPWRGLQTVWWTWTAPADMKVGLDYTGTIATENGVPAYANVEIYTGSTLADLRLIAANFGRRNPIVFIARQGETYQIAVDSERYWPFTAQSLLGVVQLRLDRNDGPVNDDFANRIDLTEAALPTTVHGTLVNASREPAEWALGENYSSGSSVWYRWVAPADLALRLRLTGPDRPSGLAVFRGDELASLRRAAFNYGPSLNFRVTAGGVYAIMVYPFGWQSPLEFDLTLETIVPPANDERSQPGLIPSAGGTVSGTNIGATPADDDPTDGYVSGNSVWWEWTAPSSGTAELWSTGSTSSRALAMVIYREDPDAQHGLRYLGANNGRDITYCGGGWPCQGEIATFKAEANTRYLVQVTTYEEQAEIKLALRLLPPPINDDYAAPTTLTGLSTSVRGSNLGATREDFEWNGVAGGAQGGQSVWWVWTAPGAGRVSLDFSATVFPVQAAVRIGEVYDALDRIADNRIAPNVNYFTNRMSFSAAAGVTYHIGVDGLGDVGDIAFDLRLHPALAMSASVNGSAELEVRLTGGSTRPFVLQYSADLRRWTPILTNSLVNEVFTYVDPEFQRQAKRFYRAIELP